ncbi:hypothetical protein DFH27DRAFT_157584 [Peziza echinospora]|nr:hypothetical protein DFH27DRAFT_157584 [Peziza echinospora]
MAKPKPSDSDTPDKHLHDRTLFLLASMTGKAVTVTVKSGARFTGILCGVSTATPDLGCSMKWVKQSRAAPGTQEDNSTANAYFGGGPEKMVVFPGQEIVEIHAEKVILGDPESSRHAQNGIPQSGFRTDTDISGGSGPTRERELHRWEPTPDEAANTGLGLEEGAPGGGAWDQFAENERLFGVKSNFDEHIYTTRVDKSHPLYHQREAEAAKIAREIEGTSSKNAHIAEERGVSYVDDSGMDEEDKYSGVQRTVSAQPTQPTQVSFPPLQSTGPAKYTPPAKRAPSGHPTVPGAPHDPAIIASALARPETLQQQKQNQPKLPVPQVKLTQPDEPPKAREKPVLPEAVVKKVAAVTNSAAGKTTAAPQFEQQVSSTFKQFVHAERERYEEKKREIIRKDKDVKLQDLMKFAREFKLHTPVPNDLIPILAKDKAKQAEIVEKARLASINAPAKATTTPSAPPAPAATTPAAAPVAHAPSGQHIDKQMYKQIHKPSQNYVPHQSFGRDKPIGVGRFGPQQPQQQLSQRLLTARGAHNAGHPVNRTPGPIADNSGGMGSKSHAPVPANMLKMNARASEFKPNPTASTFTPSFGGASASTPSPTASIGQANASRAASPSAFFGVKKLKSGKEEKACVSDFFNPFKRVKVGTTTGTQTTSPQASGSKGRDGKAPIDKQFTGPTWPIKDENKDKKYDQIFDKPEYTANTMSSPQPPHMHPHQPHHQAIPPHMSHPSHVPPPHLAHPHQPHHPHHPQQHLGIPPPHFDQDQHIRHLPTPPSVIPSPHLPTATLAYGSPSTHHAQLSAIYAQHGPMPPYGPGAPGAPQFGYGVHHRGGYFMQPGANGAPGNPVMVPGQPPVPYMSPFVQLPVYSPQQMHSYPGQAGPPPPAPPSTGYPSPRGAPMMMHQNSQGQAPPPPQMMQMGMPPQQAGMYGAGAAQQQIAVLLPLPLLLQCLAQFPSPLTCHT